MATVGYFLLLGVGLTSLRAARRRLRYETWYYLHLYTYLAIALAFSHQFANGAAFVDNAIARFAWELLYLITAALIVWYRLIVPARDFGRHRFVVAGLREEADRTVSVYIKGRDLDELGAAPRAVLPLALPHPRAVVAVAPVLAVGAAERHPHAHHRP